MMLVDAAKDDIKSMIFQKEEYLKFIEKKGSSGKKAPNKVVEVTMDRAEKIKGARPYGQMLLN